jgi:CubicO group peptidase (beta-lactamase class C family)
MNVDPAAAGFSADRLARITDHLNRHYIEPGKIAGCQTLVSRGGTPAYYSALGRMDIERNKPMADDTIFRIYSMSKPITSIALMQLYERGLFQLNDPVHRAIPSWRDQQVYVSGEGDRMETRPPKRPMTFRHVLSHTGGLCYGNGTHPVEMRYREERLRERGQDLETFVSKLGRMPLRYDPGEQWMYSYSTDVCGYLVEALSGQRFDHYLKENIFGPLGMKDTAFSVVPQNLPRFAANYSRRRDKTLELIDDPEKSVYLDPPTFLSGGGGLTGTLDDYARFCEMLRRGGELDGERIIGSRTLELMTRNHLRGDADLTQLAIGAFSETAYEGAGFGLGFAMTLDEVDAGVLGAGDFYWGGAASTIFWVDPVEDLFVVFMTQLMPSATFNFRGQLKSIIYSALDD